MAVSIIKIALLLELIYRFYVVSVKIPMLFFTELEKKKIKQCGNSYGITKRPQIVKAILRRKNTSGDSVTFDFKLYHRENVVMITGY